MCNFTTFQVKGTWEMAGKTPNFYSCELRPWNLFVFGRSQVDHLDGADGADVIPHWETYCVSHWPKTEQHLTVGICMHLLACNTSQTAGFHRNSWYGTQFFCDWCFGLILPGWRRLFFELPMNYIDLAVSITSLVEMTVPCMRNWSADHPGAIIYFIWHKCRVNVFSHEMSWSHFQEGQR